MNFFSINAIFPVTLDSTKSKAKILMFGHFFCQELAHVPEIVTDRVAPPPAQMR
uniref:Uncharacterized protein n=1 Tax=Oryza brachyantha TaxID=4533 RepID=J3MNT9_ORYBR